MTRQSTRLSPTTAKVISVVTSDSQIWNRDDVLIELAKAMSDHKSIIIDLLMEGPDLDSIGLIELISKLRKQFQYFQPIQISTNNLAQSDFENYIIIRSPPMHFVKNTRECLAGVDKSKQIDCHFGIFIGRSNLHRLFLSSHLNKNHYGKTIQTYHYDKLDDFHRNNLGLLELIERTGFDHVDQALGFLKSCPIMLDSVPTYPILMDQHCEIHRYYPRFFVEIVCETYFSGQTFFPTEKIWRPIAMKTPFIVQGPRYFLHRLRDLGFQTFNNWWSEGYSEDPADWQSREISTILDDLASRSVLDLKTMYRDMTDVLEHNFNTLMNLSLKDFGKLAHD